jgi:transposase
MGDHAPQQFPDIRLHNPKLVAVALANKMARIAWKLMATGQSYVGKSSPVVMAKAA